jgi:hypothetical protein
LALKSYSFNNNAVHFYTPIRHLKELRRSGLNAASGNFPAGSNVRIKNRRPG